MSHPATPLHGVSHPDTSRPSRRHCSSDFIFDFHMHPVFWQGKCTVPFLGSKRTRQDITGLRPTSRTRQGFGREEPRKERRPFLRRFGSCLPEGRWWQKLNVFVSGPAGIVGRHYPRMECADRLVTRRVISGAAREIGSEGPEKGGATACQRSLDRKACPTT
jgi:hypothetical protein